METDGTSFHVEMGGLICSSRIPQALFPQDDGPLSVWLNSQVMSLVSISQHCCFVQIGHFLNSYQWLETMHGLDRFTFSEHSVKLAAEVVGFSSTPSCFASKHSSSNWLSFNTWRIALWNLLWALEAEFLIISRVNQHSDTKRTNKWYFSFVAFLP